MLNPWYCATLLAFETQDVVRLRIVKIARGGAEAVSEAHMMVAEKFGAAAEAFGAMMFGSAPISIIQRLREQVAANALRLMGETLS